MRKKFITTLSVLSLLCCLGGVACQNNDTPSSSSGSDIVLNGQTVISDFENWEPDFSLIKVIDGQGKITWNEDAQYAKTGVGSAKIYALGGVNDGTFGFYVPLTSALYEYNYADITKHASYGADFYNAENEDVTLKMSLVFAKDCSMRIEAKTYVLKPGWNRVDFSTLQYPYIFTKPTITSDDYEITECTGVYFGFDNTCTEEYDINDAAIIYMDNFSCKPLSANQLSVTFEESELFYNANTTVNIPSHTFTNQEGDIVSPTVETVLKKDGEEIAITDNSFTPMDGGTYVLHMSATYNGETTDYTYDFIIRNAPKSNELESFDSKYSLANVTGNAGNMTFEYEENMSATDDGSGCVRVINQHAWGWPGVKVSVRQDLDPMQYDYISFKMYIEGENMRKYIDKGDGKKYRKIALWNETVIREIPTDEWVEIVIDVDSWYQQYIKADPELKNNLVANSGSMCIVYVFDDLESGFGENYQISYLIDEYMIYKREYAVNELESCGTVVSSASFSGDYSAFTYDSTVSHTDDGSGSVCVTENGPWPNVNLKVSRTTEEILAYDFVTFWVYIDAPGGLINGARELALYGETLGRQYVQNRTWTMFAVSTDDFVSRVSDGLYFRFIVLMNDGNHFAAGTKMYIDEIMLVNKEYAANELDNCANSLSMPNFTSDIYGIVSYSATMSHTNDGTGSVAISQYGGWPGLYFYVTKTKEEILAYDKVSFWVYIDSDKGYVDSNKKEICFLGESVAQRLEVNKWVKVTYDTEYFVSKISDGQVKLFWVQNDGYQNDPTLVTYFDEFMLEND